MKYRNSDPMKKLLILLLVLPLMFADFGPAPPAPRVTVKLYGPGIEGATPIPYGGEMNVTYYCNASMLNLSSDLIHNWGYRVNFICANWECHNDGWGIYKFSPCYYPEHGYFNYSINGLEMTSQDLGFADGNNYDVKVDMYTGKILSDEKSQPICPFFALIIGLVVLAYIRVK